MTKLELLEKLKELNTIGDGEARHSDLEDALLEYIDDERITEEYNRLDKWYA